MEALLPEEIQFCDTEEDLMSAARYTVWKACVRQLMQSQTRRPTIILADAHIPKAPARFQNNTFLFGHSRITRLTRVQRMRLRQLQSQDPDDPPIIPVPNNEDPNNYLPDINIADVPEEAIR